MLALPPQLRKRTTRNSTSSLGAATSPLSRLIRGRATTARFIPDGAREFARSRAPPISHLRARHAH